MQDSEKRIIFRFVSAILIASRVIFFLEVSIKIILTHNIKRCILLAPYIGQARIHLFYFYLLHPQTFSNKSLLLSEEKRIFAKKRITCKCVWARIDAST